MESSKNFTFHFMHLRFHNQFCVLFGKVLISIFLINFSPFKKCTQKIKEKPENLIKFQFFFNISVNNAKPVQEEKFKPSEVKTTKATTAAPSNVNGNSKRRFSGSKSSYAKPIIQDQQAQNIEEQPAPRTSSFRRPSRFALRNN